MEYLLVTSKDTQITATLYDPVSFNIKHFYKNGGVVSPNAVDLVASDYLLAADTATPRLQVFPVNSQDPVKKFETILPGKAGALAVCPNNEYLAVGIANKLYLWNLGCGKLFSVEQKTYQDITVIKWCKNFILYGSKDGSLIVYDLLTLISTVLKKRKPKYIKNDHRAEITGLDVENFGKMSRVCTCSLDQTVCMYNLHSGELLMKIQLPEAATALVLDKFSRHLYIGTAGGKIHHVDLKEPPRSVQGLLSDTKARVFESSSKDAVNCLWLDRTHEILACGSGNSVKLYKIRSGKVYKVLETKGCVTNIRFVQAHANFTAESFKIKHCIKALDKEVDASKLFVFNQIQDCRLSDSEDEKDDVEASEKVTRLEDEILKLKATNSRLGSMFVKLKSSGI